MYTNELVAAIAINSTCLWGGVAVQKSNGTLEILAVAQEANIDNAIRLGQIWNRKSAGQLVSNIINKLESQLDQVNITKVYVGVGGQSIKARPHTITHTLVEKQDITEELMDELMNQNTSQDFGRYRLLQAIPQRYTVDNITQDTPPVGVMAKHIRIDYLNLIWGDRFEENLTHIFQECNLEIADVLPIPVTMGKHMLTDTERKAGSIFIDMGAQVTNVNLYTDNFLRHTFTIPLGGDNVLYDIANELNIQSLPDDTMEDLINLADTTDNPQDSETLEIDNKKIRRMTINDIATARVEEIVENIWSLLLPYEHQRANNTVLTGGLAQLQGLNTIFEKRTQLPKRDFRLEPFIRISCTLQGYLDCTNSGHLNALLTTLQEAKPGCCEDAIRVQRDLFGNKTETIRPTEGRKLAKEELKLAKSSLDDTTDTTSSTHTEDEGDNSEVESVHETDTNFTQEAQANDNTSTQPESTAPHQEKRHEKTSKKKSFMRALGVHSIINTLRNGGVVNDDETVI